MTDPITPDGAKPIACFIYLAKSTKDKHLSIPAQLKDCDDAINSLNQRRRPGEPERIVIDVFPDENFTAFTGNRGPGLIAAERAAAAWPERDDDHPKAEFWVQHTDRLARGAGDKPGAADSGVEVWHRMRRKNTHIRSAWNDEMTKSAVLMAIASEQAHNESLRKSKGVGPGHARRKKERKKQSGVTAWGYDYGLTKEHDRVVIKARRPQAIRLFEDSCRYSSRKVARLLIERKVPTKNGGRWNGNRVADIVRNLVYRGVIGVDGNGDEIYVKSLRIVSDELWFEANKKLDDRSTPAHNPDHGRPPKVDRYLVRGMLTCGVCGRPMWVQTVKSGEFYICSSRALGVEAHCGMPRVRRDRVDPAVFAFFEHVGVDKAATQAQMLAAADLEIATIQEALETARHQQAELIGLPEVMLGHLSQNVITPEDYRAWKSRHDEAVRATDAEVNQLARRLEAAVAAPLALTDDVLGYLAEIRAAIAGAVTAEDHVLKVRGALYKLFSGFILHQPGEGSARFNADLWLPTADLYLEPQVRPERLRGWVPHLTGYGDGANVTPDVVRAALDGPGQEMTGKG